MDGRIRNTSRALPSGTILASKYRIVSVLGGGGFGITYMGERQDGKSVAIKEYFPSSFALRESGENGSIRGVESGDDGNGSLTGAESGGDGNGSIRGAETGGDGNGSIRGTESGGDENGSKCVPKSDDVFNRGKRRFIREAEVLSAFQHLDGIASVYDCFEENGTAYIVMEYIEGITLKEYVTEQGVLSYAELISMLSPIMRALIQIHRHGVIHRDISPDNILIGLDNRARLIDFGAAGILNSQFDGMGVSDGMNREDSETDALAGVNREDKERSMSGATDREMPVTDAAGYNTGKTVILKTGYAPPEQYIEGGKLGAWTDVYGMAATIYTGITGKPPLDAVTRLQREEKENVNVMLRELTDWTGGILPWQARALLGGLALSVDARYTDMQEFYEALTIAPSIEHDVTVMGHSVPDEKLEIISSASGSGKTINNKWAVPLAVVSLVLVLILSVLVGVMLVRQGGLNLQSTEQIKQGTQETDEELNEEKQSTQGTGAETDSGKQEESGTDTESGSGKQNEPGTDAEIGSGKQNEPGTDTESGSGKQNEPGIDDESDPTQTTTRKNPNASAGQQKKEKATTETIRIHEEEATEHLKISE